MSVRVQAGWAWAVNVVQQTFFGPFTLYAPGLYPTGLFPKGLFP